MEQSPRLEALLAQRLVLPSQKPKEKRQLGIELGTSG